jgi:hypothetical protein
MTDIKVPLVSLALQPIATLDIAAASGIAQRADKLCVIADDELDLAIYTLAGARCGGVALVPGVLPDAAAERKAAKPDFEALVSLPDGSLLALGSGSIPARMRGAWITFDAEWPHVRTVDLSDLYTALLRPWPELNIEGCTVCGDALVLCSRGNGARADNVLIHLDLADALSCLRASAELRASSVRAAHRVVLGQLRGTPLSLTDLTLAGDQLLFSAAAEASPNTYEDGVCAGSVLGSVSPTGEVLRVAAVSPPLKIEGICVQHNTQSRRLWLVADADDRSARAPLLAADWPG